MRIVYALVDPRTEEIRYVGKSYNGLERPRTHASHARKGIRTHCYGWIRSLLTLGLDYKIEILETEPVNLEQAERVWIAFGRGFWDLTNHTDGGDGSPGRKFSAETIAQMSATRTGRKLTEEHKNKIGAAFKGKPFSGKRADNTGAVRTPEHRAKIRAALLGRKPPQAATEKTKALWASGYFDHRKGRKKPKMIRIRRALLSVLKGTL